MFSHNYLGGIIDIEAFCVIVGLGFTTFFIYRSSRLRKQQLFPNGHARTDPSLVYPNVRVSKLLIHPIKSCRGTSVAESRYTPIGLENDRRWSIVDARTNLVLTAREHPKMVLITPKIQADDSNEHGGYLHVSFPKNSDCKDFSVPLKPKQALLDSWKILNAQMWDLPIDGYITHSTMHSSQTPSEILSDYLQTPVHLVFKGPATRYSLPTDTHPDLKASHAFQDGYPLLFLSQESVDEVNEVLRKCIEDGRLKKEDADKWRNESVEIERFRPNIVIEGGGAFSEDEWQTLRIYSKGQTPRPSQTFDLVSKCPRCMLPNIDPASGVQDKTVPFKIMTKFRLGADASNRYKPCLGMNGCPLGQGIVRVGDIVEVQKVIT